MKNVATIFTYRFFDFEKNVVRIGGVETYTLDLALLLTREGYETTVYIALDDADEYKECMYKGFSIKEIKKGKTFNECFQNLYNNKKGNGIFIVMTDEMKVNSRGKSNVISVQHGISWDKPSWAYSKKFQKGLLFTFRKWQTCHRFVSIFKKVSNMVCVDYNYYNWIRTLDEIPDDMHLAVIPNYASSGITQDEFNKKLESITDLKKSKIVLARRLTRYRGAQLFADVVIRLLKKYPELDITIAGDGDLEEKLKSDFKDYKNVHMTKYSADQSIDFHKQFDIAVVPTIYSEGTSLSLCEAMASGCMPIATHVGGLTNLLIDSFNGRLCYPNEDAVYNVLDELLTMDLMEYKRMLANAYNTYISSLNKTRWEIRWMQFINCIKL
ncbi:MAG: glycosyltransferase family 4 protein [Paludibacteraceae bacterium]|nr:glycosyltransferase family 4 protein [Lachnospiraceae bacterium]MBR5822703.1 glycosyltransferase family 4 protein [Paludibacteraceae bacterium]